MDEPYEGEDLVDGKPFRIVTDPAELVKAMEENGPIHAWTSRGRILFFHPDEEEPV